MMTKRNCEPLCEAHALRISCSSFGRHSPGPCFKKLKPICSVGVGPRRRCGNHGSLAHQTGKSLCDTNCTWECSQHPCLAMSRVKLLKTKLCNLSNVQEVREEISKIYHCIDKIQYLQKTKIHNMESQHCLYSNRWFVAVIPDAELYHLSKAVDTAEARLASARFRMQVKAE